MTAICRVYGRPFHTGQLRSVAAALSRPTIWASTQPGSANTQSPALSSPRQDHAADLELWRRAAGGDAPAQQTLIERAWHGCSQRLRNFDANARDDLRQQIAASILRALATGVELESNLDGLLQWRGRAEITSFVRRQIRERGPQDPGAVLTAAGYENSPFHEIEGAELRRIIETCIAAVPNDNHRSAYGMRLFDGMQPQEIASRMQAPARQVRVWLARATALVRQCIERKLGTRETG